MARQPRISKGKTIRPTFFVFCEGETEEAYVGFLKQLKIKLNAKGEIL